MSLFRRPRVSEPRRPRVSEPELVDRRRFLQEASGVATRHMTDRQVRRAIKANHAKAWKRAYGTTIR